LIHKGDKKLDDHKIQIITLTQMRMASTYGFGHNPEEIAWKKLVDWAKPKNFLNDIESYPIFGFNNPNPSPGSAKYGYEFWIKVPVDAEPQDDIRIIEFMGGTYAVLRCDAQGDPGKNIPTAWHELIEWCKQNKKKFGHHQALEKLVSNPENTDALVLDLYCPVVE
jgi:DNA gyrase inhibitor GyrI